jgi:subtilisin-like proprotein convertase family protein
MKKPVLSICLVLALGSAARGLTLSGSVNNINAPIPDGDLNGYQSSQSFSGVIGVVSHLTLNLNITGGFNGDLYGYLSHGGSAAILLNRVGRSGSNSVGYPNTGFSINFDDGGANDVHFYQSVSYSLNGSGQLTGTWQPDGRNVDPLSSGATLAAAARSNMLGTFNGMDPKGVWTLYLADVSSGSESTLVSWSLTATVIPEPSSALLFTVGFAGLVLLIRRPLRA